MGAWDDNHFWGRGPVRDPMDYHYQPPVPKQPDGIELPSGKMFTTVQMESLYEIAEAFRRAGYYASGAAGQAMVNLLTSYQKITTLEMRLEQLERDFRMERDQPALQESFAELRAEIKSLREEVALTDPNYGSF